MEPLMSILVLILFVFVGVALVSGFVLLMSDPPRPPRL